MHRSPDMGIAREIKARVFDQIRFIEPVEANVLLRLTIAWLMFAHSLIHEMIP
jgi:hypothetical protein